MAECDEGAGVTLTQAICEVLISVEPRPQRWPVNLFQPQDTYRTARGCPCTVALVYVVPGCSRAVLQATQAVRPPMATRTWPATHHIRDHLGEFAAWTRDYRIGVPGYYDAHHAFSAKSFPRLDFAYCKLPRHGVVRDSFLE